MARQGRADRRRGVEVRLTARDEALLRALGRFRVARTGDLVRLAFAGVRRDTAAARLRRLFDARYLAIQVRGQAEESLYSLGKEGKSWLRGQGREPGPVPRGGLEHHLAIVRTWIDLAVAVGKLQGVRILSARPDWEIRAELQHAEVLVVPDLLLTLQGTTPDRKEERIVVAVEVDLGTERLPVLRRKFEGYAVERKPGLWGEGMVLAVVHGGVGRARIHGIESLLADTWGGHWFSWRLDAGPEEAIMRLSGESVPPLATSPCGKGREEPVSNDVSTKKNARGGGPFQQIRSSTATPPAKELRGGLS